MTVRVTVQTSHRRRRRSSRNSGTAAVRPCAASARVQCPSGNFVVVVFRDEKQ